MDAAHSCDPAPLCSDPTRVCPEVTPGALPGDLAEPQPPLQDDGVNVSELVELFYEHREEIEAPHPQQHPQMSLLRL